MALESMASLSDLLSCLLSSSTPPSPSISSTSLKPIARPSQCTLPSSVSATARPSQQLSMTMTTTTTTTTAKFFFTADHGDVINRVAYPSLASANLVFFMSGHYNVEVVPKDGESEDQLVNDFKRSVFRAGVLQEARRRRFFESSQEKRKRKTKEAARKNRKRRPIPKPKPHSAPESHSHRNVGGEAEEDDDNWELPPEEIEIPYTNRS
ncbi:unnamed protein product [Microthlaspi erraticum]|uniref:30S ribosomal protein S21, chloroplastic n=1 Tax=Microthlaspi erraticum TaxID=1685480 RepID=A0A6D2J5X0_9BRAS|nr:unnamed protein product [Microthlaspi erraticum]